MNRPDDLGDRGAAFFDAATDECDFGSDEAQLLLELCRSLDLVDRLNTELSDQPMTTKGSRGQIVSNPLLSEVRAERSLIAKLVKQLGLSDVADSQPPAWTSQRARDAANERWRQEKSA